MAWKRTDEGCLKALAAAGAMIEATCRRCRHMAELKSSALLTAIDRKLNGPNRWMWKSDGLRATVSSAEPIMRCVECGAVGAELTAYHRADSHD